MRKAFDARTRRGTLRLSEPTFSYVVDATFASPVSMRESPGSCEVQAAASVAGPSAISHSASTASSPASEQGPSVVVVGAGPAGLFAALELAESGRFGRVVVVERGQPVAERGRDIGALLVRRLLNVRLDGSRCRDRLPYFMDSFHFFHYLSLNFRPNRTSASARGALGRGLTGSLPLKSAATPSPFAPYSKRWCPTARQSASSSTLSPTLVRTEDALC